MGVMDPDGGEWQQSYEVAAPDERSTMDAGRREARKANRYAQAVCCHGARLLADSPDGEASMSFVPCGLCDPSVDADKTRCRHCGSGIVPRRRLPSSRYERRSESPAVAAQSP